MNRAPKKPDVAQVRLGTAAAIEACLDSEMAVFGYRRDKPGYWVNHQSGQQLRHRRVLRWVWPSFERGGPAELRVRLKARMSGDMGRGNE